MCALLSMVGYSRTLTYLYTVCVYTHMFMLLAVYWADVQLVAFTAEASV